MIKTLRHFFAKDQGSDDEQNKQNEQIQLWEKRSPMRGIYGMIIGVFWLMLTLLFWGLSRAADLSLAIGGFGVLIIVLSLLFNYRHIEKLRKAGIYPQKGLALEKDVENLVDAGYIGEAIRCYCEVENCDIRSAKRYVDDLIEQKKYHLQKEEKLQQEIKENH